MKLFDIRCQGCQKAPGELEEYVEAAAEERMAPDEYVRKEEGTYNFRNGHFLCTPCYLAVGAPSGPKGWICP